MENTTTIVIKKDQGFMQAFLQKVQAQVKAGNATLTDGKITNSELRATLDALDKINEAHKKNGESIFAGATNRDGLKSDWHKNYVVQPNQEITLTQDEMNALYTALGVEIKKSEIQENIDPNPVSPADTTEVANPSDTTGAIPPVDTTGVTNPTDTTTIGGTHIDEGTGDSAEKKGNAWKWILGGVGTALLVGAAIYLAKSGKGKEAINKVKDSFKKKPEPVKPEPVKPEPVKPEPVKPEPVKPEPVKPEPVKPEPVKPEPVKPEPVKPEPVKPEPVKPEPVKPEPVKPEPVKPEPVKPESVKPEPGKKHRKDLSNGDVRRTTPDDARPIDVSGVNGKERKLVQEAFDGVPTEKQTQEFAESIAYQAPTTEQKQVMEAIHAANKEQSSVLNSIEHNHTGATTQEIREAVAKAEAEAERLKNLKEGLYDYVRNGNHYVIEVGKNGKVSGILTATKNGYGDASYLTEKQIEKFLRNNPKALETAMVA